MRGGHSSRPTPGNAIYRLARALERVSALRFPTEKSEVTLAAFRAAAPKTPGEAGEAMRHYVANPDDQQAIEVLSRFPDPQLAAAHHLRGNIDRRWACAQSVAAARYRECELPHLPPGVAAATVKQLLVGAIADTSVSVEYDAVLTRESAASPLRPDVIKAGGEGGACTLSGAARGAVDVGGRHRRRVLSRGRHLPPMGCPASSWRSADHFEHGLNERVPLAAIEPAVTHWESLLRDLAKINGVRFIY